MYAICNKHFLVIFSLFEGLFFKMPNRFGQVESKCNSSLLFLPKSFLTFIDFITIALTLLSTGSAEEDTSRRN